MNGSQINNPAEHNTRLPAIYKNRRSPRYRGILVRGRISNPQTPRLPQSSVCTQNNMVIVPQIAPRSSISRIAADFCTLSPSVLRALPETVLRGVLPFQFETSHNPHYRQRPQFRRSGGPVSDSAPPSNPLNTVKFSRPHTR